MKQGSASRADLLQKQRVLLGQHAGIDKDRELLRREDAVHDRHVLRGGVGRRGQHEHARVEAQNVLGLPLNVTETQRERAGEQRASVCNQIKDNIA
jgi:hypothetical protein